MILERKKQKLILGGEIYTAGEILDGSGHSAGKAFRNELFLFLKEWFGKEKYMEVQTSGSTGRPKIIKVEKSRMIRSAESTCEFLGLKKNETALLCMPLRYIAGKMMVVRSLVGELNLIIKDPDGHPYRGLNGIHIDFNAMVPLQVFNSLGNEKEKEYLSDTNKIIIGGGAIGRELEASLGNLPGAVFSSYGMTETLSHIALRQLNGPQASESYRLLPSVKISLSKEGTLTIDAPRICKGKLLTNDLAEIREDGSFIIIGRKDNVIDSGGIKIQIEEIEEELRNIIKGSFAVTSRPDKKLGEAVCLLYSGMGKEEMEKFREKIEKGLKTYHRPRFYIPVPEIPLTGNGKTDRKSCRELASAFNPQDKYSFCIHGNQNPDGVFYSRTSGKEAP